MIKIKRIVSFMMTFVFCIGVFGGFLEFAFAEETTHKIYEALDTFDCIWLYPKLASEMDGFYYNDKMLINNIGAGKPSGEISLASVGLSVSAYDVNEISYVMEQMGFNTLYTSEYYSQNTTHYNNDVVAYSIAEKYVSYNNELYRLVLVPMRGTMHTCEWYSDLKLGSGSDHYGFYTAAQKVLVNLKSYIQDPYYNVDHTIIWTMGHSRGAAVANIVAGTISTNSEWKTIIPKSYVFGYTYACPSVSLNADTSLKNIYNYNNGGDVVPSLPLPDWGYKRFGQTIKLPEADYENLKQRYKYEMENDYVVGMSTVNWEATFKSIVPTAEKYANDDKIQLAVDILAYVLGGYSDSNYLPYNILLDHPSAMVEVVGGIVKTKLFPMDTIMSLKKDISAASLQMMLDSDLQEYLDLETELMKAISETSTMRDTDSEDEEAHKKYLQWINWKSSHSSLINRAENYTNIRIEYKGDISAAYSVAGTRYEDYKGIVSLIRDVLALFFDSNGRLDAPFTQAHPQLTYQLWVNSMYYGFEGWYGNQSITKVDWKDREQTSFTGIYCFSDCGNIESVTIPDNMYIGECSFAYCNNLKDINFAGEGITIESGAFGNCTNLTDLVIPDNIAKINEGAFSGCEKLTSLTAPYDPDCYNGKDFFYDCINIKNLTITKGRSGEYYDISPDFCPWYSNSYYHNPCKFIENVTVAEGVKSLGVEMLAYYDSMTTIELPLTLERLACDSFIYNHYASRLSKVIYNGDVSSWCNIDFGNRNSNPLWLLWLHDKGDMMYIGENKPTALVIPKGVEEIKPYAFCGYTNIESLTMNAEGVTIGQEAFLRCENLKSVTISKNTVIGDLAFADCFSLTDINFADEGIVIGANAFADCENLKTLVIPDNVAKINTAAFSNCINLTNLTSPYDSDCYEGNDWFYNCAGIENLTITKGRTGEYYEVPSFCPWSNSSIAHIRVAEGVKSLGHHMFAMYYDLKDIELPSTLERVAESAFLDDYQIAKVTFNGDIASWCNVDFNNKYSNPLNVGNGVLYIGENEITELTIPKGVSIIKPYVFYGCTIRSVAFSDDITEIQEEAFNDCENINDVYFEGTEEQWNNILIYSGNESILDANIHFNSDISTPDIPFYSSITVNKIDTDTEWKFEITVSEPQSNHFVYVGIYDKYNKLVELKRTPLLTNKNTVVEMEYTEIGTTAKIFVWNIGLMPLIKAVEIKL